jgi:hypothetical protein
MDLTGLKVYPLVTLRNVTSRDKSSEAVIQLMSTVIIPTTSLQCFDQICTRKITVLQP